MDFKRFVLIFFPFFFSLLSFVKSKNMPRKGKKRILQLETRQAPNKSYQIELIVTFIYVSPNLFLSLHFMCLDIPLMCS